MRSRVLVTGAVGGLGKAFAAECAARGWDLLVTDRDPDRLRELAEGLRRMGGVEVLALAADLACPADRDRFWQEAEAEGVRLFMAINVAGLDFEGPFGERTCEELCTIVRVNVEATVAMTRAALPFRDPMRTFRIINVSSLAGFQPMPVKATYAASKRFLLDFSIALDRELRGSGVRVLALCPAGLPSNAALVRAIEAQGLAGRLTTLNVGTVAARTLDRSLRGKTVYVPGLGGRLVGYMGRIAPPSLSAFLVGRRWQKARAGRELAS